MRKVQASVGFGDTGEHLHLIYHNSFIPFSYKERDIHGTGVRTACHLQENKKQLVKQIKALGISHMGYHFN